MTQPMSQRLNYHPDPRRISNSDRKVRQRLDFILSKVDFKGKTVLDLGCSGGFFSFELSKVSERIIAVDGDREIIERNKNLQDELKIKNIEFICAPIDAKILDKIGNIDIVLFLSVFHHMLTASDAYDWNDDYDASLIDLMISKLNELNSTLIFEMGEVNEGYEWCERMPKQAAFNEKFTKENIFQSCYTDVSVYSPPTKMNMINRVLVSKLSSPFKTDSRLISLLKRISKYDSRDLRKIYIGNK